MSHRRRFLRIALRFFNLDSRFTSCLSKRLGTICGCCGTDATNHYRHNSSCISKLAELPVPDSEPYADLLAHWREGYTLKSSGPFPTSGTGCAYYMGRDSRLAYLDRTIEKNILPIAV